MGVLSFAEPARTDAGPSMGIGGPVKLNEAIMKRFIRKPTRCICPKCGEIHKRALGYRWAGVLPAKLYCAACFADVERLAVEPDQAVPSVHRTVLTVQDFVRGTTPENEVSIYHIRAT